MMPKNHTVKNYEDFDNMLIGSNTPKPQRGNKRNQINGSFDSRIGTSA